MVRLLPDSDSGCIDEAVRLLREGQLVAYPTDTVYGIGVAAGNDAAVRRLFAVKGRPLDKPVPLLISDAGEAASIADVTPAARELMGRFWPGALTIVMGKAEGFRSLALAGRDRVALRVPDHDVVRDVIRRLAEPIVGTSANRAGARPPVSASEAAFQLGEMVSLVVDGGVCRGGRESTVVDITAAGGKILREGGVSRAEVDEALGRTAG
jgi:L-threonylcarbamoyladenylate synthase